MFEEIYQKIEAEVFEDGVLADLELSPRRNLTSDSIAEEYVGDVVQSVFLRASKRRNKKELLRRVRNSEFVAEAIWYAEAMAASMNREFLMEKEKPKIRERIFGKRVSDQGQAGPKFPGRRRTKMKRIALNVTDDLHAEILKTSAKLDVTVTELIRRSIFFASQIPR